MKTALKVTSLCRCYSTIMNLGHRSVLLNEMKTALKVTSLCRGYSTIMNLGHRSVLLNEMKTALKVTSLCRGYSTIMNLGRRAVLLNEMETALKVTREKNIIIDLGSVKKKRFSLTADAMYTSKWQNILICKKKKPRKI